MTLLYSTNAPTLQPTSERSHRHLILTLVSRLFPGFSGRARFTKTLISDYQTLRVYCLGPGGGRLTLLGAGKAVACTSRGHAAGTNRAAQDRARTRAATCGSHKVVQMSTETAANASLPGHQPGRAGGHAELPKKQPQGGLRRPAGSPSKVPPMRPTSFVIPPKGGADRPQIWRSRSRSMSPMDCTHRRAALLHDREVDCRLRSGLLPAPPACR